MYQGEIKDVGLQSSHVSLLEEVIIKANFIYEIYCFSVSLSVHRSSLKENLMQLLKSQSIDSDCLFIPQFSYLLAV